VSSFDGSKPRDATGDCGSGIVLDPAVKAVSPSEVDAEDIESRRLWKPMHVQPVFASGRFFVDGETERLFDCGVNQPSGSVLDDDQIEDVMKVLQTVLGSER
jgi:dTDP-4-amino-4,6-dideoxygalactose transaminase